MVICIFKTILKLQIQEFFLRPLNAKFTKEKELDSEKRHTREEQIKHLRDLENNIDEEDSVEVSRKSEILSQGLYTSSSNTVFYYNEYKVLFVLDFSKSTTTFNSRQSRPYIEKIKDSIEIFISVRIRSDNQYRIFSSDQRIRYIKEMNRIEQEKISRVIEETLNKMKCKN